MKKLLLFLSVGMTFPALGQTNYVITTVGNNWSDELLYIHPGDSITFINTSGMHNLNGSQATFPSNPESFGQLRVGEGWIYGFRFNIEGVYSYTCDVQVGTMGGVIIVDQTASQVEHSLNSEIYPNPTSGIVYIEGAQNADITVYDMLGNSVLKVNKFSGDQIDLSLLNTGEYHILIRNGTLEDRRRIFKQ